MTTGGVSIVVLSWDQLHHTKRCVESIRRTADIDYELIIVDNGSADDVRKWTRAAADIHIQNESNQGFAAANNQALAKANHPYIMFLNNDTQLPEHWTRLLDTARSPSNVGITVPVLTKAGMSINVRDNPGDEVITLLPFGSIPSAVCYLMRTGLIRTLGGWNESYPIASGEDLDLAYTVWTNGLEIIVDERVLVEHIGHGTSDDKFTDREELWYANRKRFIARWIDLDAQVPRLDMCPPEMHAWNRRVAATSLMWQEKYERYRDRAKLVTEQRDRWHQELGACREQLQAQAVKRSPRSRLARIRQGVREALRPS